MTLSLKPNLGRTHLNSEKKNEIGTNDSNGCVLKIRVAASTALKELDQMRSAGPVRQEALDVEEDGTVAVVLWRVIEVEALNAIGE